MTTYSSTNGTASKSLWQQRLSLFLKNLRSNWRLFIANRIGLIGLITIAFFGILAVLHPILMNTVWHPAIYDPISGFDGMIVKHPSAPSARHLLGTDPFGRDILSQIMYSTRWEFALGVITALATAFIATTIGAIAAYFGGIVDTILMRLADLIIMLPALAILIVLSAFTDLNIIILAIVLGLLRGFGSTAIVVKSQALAIKVKPYIEAARVAGGGAAHIIFRHLIPNLLPIALLYMMFAVTLAIFTEAVLSFLGLTEISMSWGIMINLTNTQGYLLRFDTWWLVFPASIAITALCAAFYMVGRGLDEVINPRLRRR